MSSATSAGVQVLALAVGAVRPPHPGNCSVFAGWRHDLKVRFCRHFSPPQLPNCLDNVRFTSSKQQKSDAGWGQSRDFVHDQLATGMKLHVLTIIGHVLLGAVHLLLVAEIEPWRVTPRQSRRNLTGPFCGNSRPSSACAATAHGHGPGGPTAQVARKITAQSRRPCSGARSALPRFGRGPNPMTISTTTAETVLFHLLIRAHHARAAGDVSLANDLQSAADLIRRLERERLAAASRTANDSRTARQRQRIIRGGAGD